MRLRLVTYNIRLGIQEGLASIADVLAPEHADVIALQEVGRDWTMGPPGDSTAELAALLEMEHFRHVGCIVEGDAQYGHALLSRWPFASQTVHELPEDIDEPRRLLETHLDTPLGRVRVLSTHLSHVDDRPPQGELLLELTREHETPTVVLGDLNATSDEPFLAELLELTTDADPAGRHTFPASAPTRRIDYILARDGVLDDTTIGANSTASDHVYVAATWTFNLST